MSGIEIVSDASDAGELIPWNLLQEGQEREAEPADEEPTDVAVTADLQQTSLHCFGQATWGMGRSQIQPTRGLRK